MRTYEHAISGTGGPVPYTGAASNKFDVDGLSTREQSVLLRVLLREHRSSLDLRNEHTRMVVGAICEKIAQRPVEREVRYVVHRSAHALSLFSCVVIMLAVLGLAAFALYCGYGFLAFLFGIAGVVICTWGLCLCERGLGA